MRNLAKYLRFLLLIVGITLLLWFSYAFFDRQFKLSNVTGNWPKVKATPLTAQQQEQLKDLFSSPFHYLDRGKQSFVFVSNDSKYVLKLFDARCLRSGDFFFLFSITEEHCAKKLAQLFEGYRVAETYDSEHTGLVALQLVPDPSYSLPITVIDRFGLRHNIDLASVPFAVQRKAIPLREVISALLAKEKIQEAIEHIQKILDMYIQGYQQGVIDTDHNFMYNTGFVDDRPIRIDLGRLQFQEAIKDPAVYRQDLDKVFIERLGEWLERHFPKYRHQILIDMKK